jgi:tryptophan synthase alpha subunit
VLQQERDHHHEDVIDGLAVQQQEQAVHVHDGQSAAVAVGPVVVSTAASVGKCEPSWH